jgi:peptidoglycan/xylan/chitin deacetylase (PgdA/CDA1 family)
MRPNPEIRRIRDNFDRYRELRRNRAAALSRKVAFRLLVPRQRALALRNPSMARQRRRRAQPESIALCYHAVSEDWPAALSVRPDSLRRQLSLLLDRGYEPVTFSELVLGDADGARRMAVTFDDGYASVHDRALPILEQLGIPGTLFIPTAFVPGTELLGWEGIGQWAQTEHAEELRPLSAEQLRAIAAAGWEIGSHSRTHPRLTQLNDEQLAAELRGSREDTERVLSAPCLSIAYPYGDVDERVERAAAEAGYACAAALPAGRLVGSRNAWPRVGIYNADDDRRFKLKVARPMLALRRSRAWNLRA